MANFVQIFDKLKDDYARTEQNPSEDAYVRLSTIFDEMDAYLREYVQAATREPVQAIIRKLENGEALSDEDKDMVRLWIVGDADYYTKMEVNEKEWEEELRRVMDEVALLRTETPDVTTACKLRGVLRDGAQVIADLLFFAGQKDRSAKFTEAIREIDTEERSLLIGLLKQKMDSPDY